MQLGLKHICVYITIKRNLYLEFVCESKVKARVNLLKI